MKTKLLSLAALLVSAVVFAADDNKPSPVGYSDTPLIPGSKWKVHDIDRPAPPVVAPGAKLGDAPADAIIIFNGKDTSQLFSR
ncbi:MAG: DUF1080 domain-containing protein, partial [Opitutaceae bacterium]|nr:DUF1080 domain-containing protein [Opitutaceae bacterium]